MGCQKAIANQVIEEKADYVLSLKENHPLLHEEVEEYFEYTEGDNFKDEHIEHLATRDEGH